LERDVERRVRDVDGDIVSIYQDVFGRASNTIFGGVLVVV